jgi:hypothetical protein
VLREHYPDRPVFRLVDIPAEVRADEGNGMSREVPT